LKGSRRIEVKDASAYNAEQPINERHCFHFSPGAEMKQFFLAMWMCLTIGMTVLSGQDGAPSMVVDNPVKDFGNVMKGEMVKHTFRFSNEGSSTLEILGAEATCGCQETLLSSKQIEAGQSGQIDVSVDTSVLIGAVTESVKIFTNDPQHPSVLLSIKADVQQEISLSSPSIYFGDVPKGKEVTEEIIITVPAEKSIKILSAESSDESVKVRLEPVPESKEKKVKLIATYRTDGKIGYRLGNITVKTTSYLTPELSINLIIRNFNR
jgi:hypothetical protein